jgi:hypothetical protein
VTRSSSSLVCGVFLTLCVACGSDPTEAGGAAGSAGSAGSAAQAGSGAGGSSVLESCPAGPGYETETEPVQVGVVSGLIVDEQGEPTSSGLVQVCAKDLCINANVPDTGELSEAVRQLMDAPACKFGNGKVWGKLAIPLAAGDTDLGTLTTVRLPDYADAAPLTPGRTATSAGVSLTLAEDAVVEIDTLTYEDESQYGLRAALLPPAALEQLKQGFALAYALSPVETHICPSPALSLENSAELEPGAELELFVLGLDVLEAWAPYATWQKVGEGVVSEDGRTLEFPNGVPILTAIGVKAKP